MSKFKRKVNRNNVKNKADEFCMDLVAATENKKLYITSATAERIREGKEATIKLVERYTKKYPAYQLTVNDNYYQWLLGFIPA